jgi:hypothetical protein
MPPGGSGGSEASPEAKPRCDASPGAPPGGFILTRSHELPYRDHVGVREEYRDQDGRLLVYLLGVMGEMGEGAPIAEDIELATGVPATLFGTPDREAWSVVWTQELPCPQMAVVGNSFTREGFEAVMREMGLLAPIPPDA